MTKGHPGSSDTRFSAPGMLGKLSGKPTPTFGHRHTALGRQSPGLRRASLADRMREPARHMHRPPGRNSTSDFHISGRRRGGTTPRPGSGRPKNHAASGPCGCPRSTATVTDGDRLGMQSFEFDRRRKRAYEGRVLRLRNESPANDAYGGAPAIASSTDRRSSSAISSISARVALYGGATIIWSPRVPSIFPPVG